MRGRSSPLSVVLALAACGKGNTEPAKPEADPAEVTKLAAVMARNVPTPAAVKDCGPDDLRGGVTLVYGVGALALLWHLSLVSFGRARRGRAR